MSSLQISLLTAESADVWLILIFRWTPLNERQLWILDQLRSGIQVTRTMVENQFDIREKQAKRELAGLTNSGLVAFIRKPRPGFYKLRIAKDD